MSVYLKSAVWDLLLCIVASCALGYTLCSGFYSTLCYQSFPSILCLVGACTLICMAFFAITLNRRVMPFAATGFAIVLIGLVGLAIFTSATASALYDEPGNNMFFALVVELSCLAVLLLSRRRALVIALACMGVYACGVIEYLYWQGHIIAFALFIVSVIGLYAYRSYQASLLDSESESLAFASVSLSALAFGAASVLVACGVAFSVVTVLSPSNVVVKLLTEHYRADEIEVKGVASLDELLDPDTLTDETDDSSQDTNMLEEGAEGGEDEQAQDGPDALGTSVFGRISMIVPPWTPAVLAVVVALAVLVAILLKRHRRARRFSLMLVGGNGPAIEQLFLFFMDRFGRFKIPQPDTLTLSEYAEGFSDTFNRFEGTTGTPAFAALAQVYNSWAFGGNAVSDEECALFKDYYGSFYKRAARYVGRLRYCLLYFFI